MAYVVLDLMRFPFCLESRQIITYETALQTERGSRKKKEVRNKRTTDHVNVVNDTKDHTDSFNTGKGNVAFGSISCTLISKFSYYFFIHEWQALLCKSRGTDTKPSLSNNHTYSTESIPEHYSALNLLMGN